MSIKENLLSNKVLINNNNFHGSHLCKQVLKCITILKYKEKKYLFLRPKSSCNPFIEST